MSELTKIMAVVTLAMWAFQFFGDGAAKSAIKGALTGGVPPAALPEEERLGHELAAAGEDDEDEEEKALAKAAKAKAKARAKADREAARGGEGSDADADADGDAPDADADGEAPEAVKVVIEYCVSWQYKNTYTQVASVLQTRAVQKVEVEGAEYPPPPEKLVLAKFASTAQMGLLGFVVFGDKLFPRMGIDPPEIFHTLKENKMVTLMGIWMAGNMVQANLLSTGAFEIRKGDKVIWSSMEKGRLPSYEDLTEAFGEIGVEILPPPESA